jgi:5-methylcytosine-specific restriction endonuclease McrA
VRHVLLLNATHEVLRAISLKRAVVLVLQEKAEVVEAGEEYVRSAYFEMKMPKVIRLNYFVRVPWKSKVALNRRNLQARDHGQCQVVGCVRRGDTIDHIKPRSRGGAHEWDNVTLMCGKCNSAKDDKLLSELGWTLKSKPTVPRTGGIIIGIAEMDPAWEAHLAFA